MRRTLDKVLGGFLAFLMAVMTVDVLWGVFTRYVMGSQSSFTEELARFLLIWIGILGAAFAAGQHQHLAIDLLPQSLEKKNKKRLLTLINLLVMAFVLGVMVVGGMRYSYIAFKLGQLSPALRIPMGYVYLIIPVSGLLIILYKIWDMMGISAPEHTPESPLPHQPV